MTVQYQAASGSIRLADGARDLLILAVYLVKDATRPLAAPAFGSHLYSLSPLITPRPRNSPWSAAISSACSVCFS